MPARIGNSAPAKARAEQQEARPSAPAAAMQRQRHPPAQPETSTGTLDCTTPLHTTATHSSAAPGRPWMQAVFVEERHIFTEPVPHVAWEAGLHASSAAAGRHYPSDGLVDRNAPALSPRADWCADQLQDQSQEGLGAALQRAAGAEHAAEPGPACPRHPAPGHHGIGAACEEDDFSGSAGLDVIPDTVQKHQEDFATDLSEDRAHLACSSSVKKALRGLRTFVPDCLEDYDYHLEQLPGSSSSKAQQRAGQANELRRSSEALQYSLAHNSAHCRR